MQRSEAINELAAALAKAQGAMKAAVKDSSNPFYKSKYADLASITEAIKSPLSANGLSYVQMVSSDAEGHYVETMLMHASGQWIAERVRIVVSKPNDPQAFGSAVTYFRRYALQAMTGVPADDDDGNAATGKPGVHRPGDGAEDRVAENRKRAVEGVVEAARSHLSNGDVDAATRELAALTDPDEKVMAWGFFDSKERAAMKRPKVAA